MLGTKRLDRRIYKLVRLTWNRIILGYDPKFHLVGKWTQNTNFCTSVHLTTSTVSSDRKRSGKHTGEEGLLFHLTVYDGEGTRNFRTWTSDVCKKFWHTREIYTDSSEGVNRSVYVYSLVTTVILGKIFECKSQFVKGFWTHWVYIDLTIVTNTTKIKSPS